MKFTVPGRPVPAVRMTQRSKFASKKAQRYLEYKETVGWAAKSAGIKPFTGPVKLKTVFYFNNNRLPDLDNLIKSVSDGLNHIAWGDDKQVIKIEAERTHDAVERAEIEITEAI